MNFFSLPGDVTVVMDLAHNEAGLEALLEIMEGVRRPDARLLLGLGAVGDRTDELIDALGEIGAKGSDLVAIAHKERYLRNRTMDEIDVLLRAGAARVGVTDITTYTTEVECLAGLVEEARAGDVIGLMCHAERQAAYDWITGVRRHARRRRRAVGEGPRQPRTDPAQTSPRSICSPGVLMSRSPSTIIASSPPAERVSCASPGSHTAACPGRWCAPCRRTPRPGPLPPARPAADGPAPGGGRSRRRGQRDRDEVGVGADPERAHGEPRAAVGVDLSARQVGERQDPHEPGCPSGAV